MSLIMKFLDNPYMVFRQPFVQEKLHWMDDETYLKLVYRARMGKRLDLENPKGFNEKLQWLKLHDRNPLYTTLVDKYRVKDWVADKIGAEYVTKTYACWDRAEDIDIDALPERFVLKTNHDSGGIAICRDRTTFDLDAAKVRLGRSLANNYYWLGREWPYKNVKPLIFAEEYLDPAEGMDDLPDYKLYRFNTGHVVTCAMTERFTESGYTATYFDEDWHRLDMSDAGHDTRPDVPMPAQFDLMKQLSAKLAEGMPFVRVDFYVSASRLLFGEMTFYSASGFENWEPSDWDERFGSWIKLGGGYLVVNEGFSLWLHSEGVEASPMEPTFFKTVTQGIVDYKFYCFGSEPRFVYVSQGLDDHATARINFLGLDWSRAPFGRTDYLSFENLPAKPQTFDEMLRFVKKLSAGIPFVRVDFFEYRGCPRFSEMTFHPCSGFMPFDPPEWDEKVGDYLDLPRC